MIRRILAITLVLALAAPAFATPPTALVVTVVKQNNYAVQAGDLTVTLAASDAANGNTFVSTGKEILLVVNSDASPHTFTVTSIADNLGRLDTTLTAYSVAANATVAIDATVVNGWRQSDGNIYLTSASALLKFGVLRHP